MKKKKKLMLLFLLLLAGILLVPHTAQAAKKKKTVKTSQYTIYVNRKTNLVNVVDSKSHALVRAMYCSTCKGNSTIRGTYRTKAKYRWRKLVGNVYGQYSTRISGAYLFHSVPYKKKNIRTLESREYNKLGRQASKGCVRLSVADAKWIYDKCKIGTRVIINDSKVLVKPVTAPVRIPSGDNSGWDPTDPDPSNPYYPRINLVNKAKTIARNSEFDPYLQVAFSSKTTSQEVLKSVVKIQNTVNTQLPGKYTVTYTLTDPVTQLKTQASYVFTVQDIQ